MDCASPLIESEFTDALATSARAMRGLPSDSPTPSSEGCAASLRITLIGIERWRFVERAVNESLSFVTRRCPLIGKAFRFWGQARVHPAGTTGHRERDARPPIRRKSYLKQVRRVGIDSHQSAGSACDNIADVRLTIVSQLG